MLLNKTEFDNRIPPAGFVNAEFEAFGAPPVGATYADGQHWDDTRFTVPAGATQVAVTLLHQTTTPDYIDSLLNNNVTDEKYFDIFDAYGALTYGAPRSVTATAKYRF